MLLACSSAVYSQVALLGIRQEDNEAWEERTSILLPFKSFKEIQITPTHVAICTRTHHNLSQQKGNMLTTQPLKRHTYNRWGVTSHVCIQCSTVLLTKNLQLSILAPIPGTAHVSTATTSHASESKPLLAVGRDDSEWHRGDTHYRGVRWLNESLVCRTFCMLFIFSKLDLKMHPEVQLCHRWTDGRQN